MKRKFIVELEIPPGVTSADMKAYILDAVSTWKGQCRPPCGYGDNDPGDPLFFLDGSKVKVSHVARLPRSHRE